MFWPNNMTKSAVFIEKFAIYLTYMTCVGVWEQPPCFIWGRRPCIYMFSVLTNQIVLELKTWLYMFPGGRLLVHVRIDITSIGRLFENINKSTWRGPMHTQNTRGAFTPRGVLFHDFWQIWGWAFTPFGAFTRENTVLEWQKIYHFQNSKRRRIWRAVTF